MTNALEGTSFLTQFAEKLPSAELVHILKVQRIVRRLENFLQPRCHPGAEGTQNHRPEPPVPAGTHREDLQYIEGTWDLAATTF